MEYSLPEQATQRRDVPNLETGEEAFELSDGSVAACRIVRRPQADEDHLHFRVRGRLVDPDDGATRAAPDGTALQTPEKEWSVRLAVTLNDGWTLDGFLRQAAEDAIQRARQVEAVRLAAGRVPTT